MVVVGSRSFRQALVVVACTLVGCAGDPSIRLQLLVPEGAAALARVANFELIAARHGHRIAFETVPYTSGADLSLQHVGFGDDLTITVTARDANADPVAYGVIGPDVTKDLGGGVCCLTMCLCTLALFDSGGCTCGSQACETRCN